MKQKKKQTPNPSLLNVGLIKGIIKSLIGDIGFAVDREKKQVVIQARGREFVLTYDQFIDELEKLLDDE